MTQTDLTKDKWMKKFFREKFSVEFILENIYIAVHKKVPHVFQTIQRVSTLCKFSGSFEFIPE